MNSAACPIKLDVYPTFVGVDAASANDIGMIELRLRVPQGRRHRLPSFWGDVEVRRSMIVLHRQSTIDAVHTLLEGHFGTARTPSRSAIGRFWKLLDQCLLASTTEAAAVSLFNRG
jgi:hypothetical protein